MLSLFHSVARGLISGLLKVIVRPGSVPLRADLWDLAGKAGRQGVKSKRGKLGVQQGISG